MPTYLYIKECAVTGLKYFGKTSKADPYKYNGSGKYWTRHIKTHGKDNIKTIWVSEPFYNEAELSEFATFFSEEFDIVNSSKWANLTIENGIDGWTSGNPRSEETKQKMSLAKKGKVSSDETRKKISVALSNRLFTEEHKANLRKPKGKQSLLTCPVCGLIGGATGMTRWHFANCKKTK